MTDRLTPAQQRLVEDHWGWARAISHHWARGTWDDAERESEVALALCVAARSFDPERGVKFATWAARKIENYLTDRGKILQAARRRTIQRANVGLIHDRPGDDTEEQEALDDMTHGLAPRDRMIVVLWARGWQQFEIATHVGLTKSTLCRRYHKALDAIRWRLETREEA